MTGGPRETRSAYAGDPRSRHRAHPLNPRKSFNEEAIDELADSLQATGQLQNISVRALADPGDGPRWQIVFGERRWRAAVRLIEMKDWPETATLEARILDIDDAAHLELAIMENLARQDVDALEQAEAFAALQAALEAKGETASAAIAERIGVTPRTVQIHLAMARGLSPALKEAWRDGRLTKRKLASELARWPHDLQDRWLDAASQSAWLMNDDRAVNWLHQVCRSTEDAIFDMAGYRARGGEVVKSAGKEWLTDAALAREMQRAAVLARAEAEASEKGYAEARLIEAGDPERWSAQQATPKTPPKKCWLMVTVGTIPGFQRKSGLAGRRRREGRRGAR